MTAKAVVRFVQQRLNELGHEAGDEDGTFGPKTLAALEHVAEVPSEYSKRRKVIAFVQLQAKAADIDTGEVDGYWGTQTEFAFEQLLAIQEDGEPEPIWRPEGLSARNPNHWPSQATDRELTEFYGSAGTNQTMLELPYPHKLSWKTTSMVSRMQCHEKVHDSLGRVLAKVLSIYGEEGIRELRLDFWGGCFNKRKMRGGTRWSTHSWGIALDYDPGRNRLRWGRDRAVFAHPDYDEWWQCWEAEGWVSLGRTRNFDWMHIQAARL